MTIDTTVKVRLSIEEEMTLKKARDILQEIDKQLDNGNYDYYCVDYEDGMEDVINDIHRAAGNL